MPNDKHQDLGNLLEIIEVLMQKQEDLVKDIHILRMAAIQLKETQQRDSFIEPEKLHHEILLEDDATSDMPDNAEDPNTFDDVLSEHETVLAIPKPPARRRFSGLSRKFLGFRSNIEKYVGENILNVIGICVTVIGVAIGIKYSIDNELISPLTRVILSCTFGLGLLGFGIRLKEKYQSFSAVLVGGAMTILYFSTYIAYGAYALIGWTVAFCFMLIFTIFTVIAALQYNKQIIAHIGLVGAYAVPFLLSDGSGNAGVLFSYITVINIGILLIALRKYWKPLYYASFGLTWVMYASWFSTQFQSNEHSSLALIFAFAFFAEFYVAFLAYKSIHSKKYVIDDIILIVSNASLFYGYGYAVCNSDEALRPFLGIFTMINAIIHFLPGLLLYRNSEVDRNVRYLVVGLVIVFLTLTIPVQLDGNWVTVLWAGEALLLFRIGRTNQVAFFEVLSYPLMLLAFVSITEDWHAYNTSYWMRDSFARGFPFLLNVNFLTSLLFMTSFAGILFLKRSQRYPNFFEIPYFTSRYSTFLITAILVFTAYNTFRLEISHYWDQLYLFSGVPPDNSQYYVYVEQDEELLIFKEIWNINYHLLFLSLCAFANLRWLKSRSIGKATIVLLALLLLYFFTAGVYDLGELRTNYITRSESPFYERGLLNLWTRYFSLTFVAIALYACDSIVRRGELKSLNGPRNVLLHASLFLIANTELIHWIDLANSQDSYKLGMSILWGVYSLVLIVYGIWKRKKPERIGGMGLFGVTMLKIFFYDIVDMSTIEKTIIFVCMGVLLLISSFLYNKYRHIISNEESL